VFGLLDVTASDAGIDQTASEATVDGPVTCLDHWLDGSVRFGAPVAIAEVNTANYERDPFLDADELTLYFSADRTGSFGGLDTWIATRAAITDVFGSPVHDVEASSSGSESKLSITDDGLVMVIATDRPGGAGGTDIWQATRTSTTHAWGPFDESHLSAVDDAASQYDPTFSLDGLHLYLAPYNGISPQQIAMASRASRTSDFSAPTAVAGLAGASNDADPALSVDERLIVFASTRSGGSGGTDIWYASRAGPGQAFDAPTVALDINATADDGDPWLSRDGCRLYFSSKRTGSWDLYTATVR